eukprot:g6633.t1
MNDHVDLTLESEDEDLQAAIRASLSNSSGGGGGSSSGMSNSKGHNSSSSGGANGGACTTATSSSASKRPQMDSPDPQRLGHSKRPRSWKETPSQPPLFRLLSTSPGDRASNGSVGLADLLSGDFESALISNYLVDMGLLFQTQRRLGSVPVVVVHGDKGESELHLRSQCDAIGNPALRLHKPEVPSYGTHHTKMIILKFPTGVRVIVLTANFLAVDVTDKSQAVWYQDFRRRESATCDFEDCLVDYLEKVGGPAAEFGRTLRHYDFRPARVALVPSVPGTGKKKHKGRDAFRYGHMRVRALLSREREGGTIARLENGGHKVVVQVSSLASRSPDPTFWMYELLESFMPGESEGEKGGVDLGAKAKSELLGDRLRVVWPSVEAVRASTKGWISGGSICCNTDNMYGGGFKRPDMSKYRSNDPTPELKPILRKWKGNPLTNRARDAPHIKTFLRYREVPVVGQDGNEETKVDGNQVAWCLLTSSNLSTSALGFLDKKGSQSAPQLTLRSFELGVMFLPSLLARPLRDPGDDAEGLAFTCTPGDTGLTQRLPLARRYECEPGKVLPLDLLPLPYVLPAPRYDFAKNPDDSERPWVWDQAYSSLDHTGSSWPGVGR